jgi:hypothetical protein
MASIVGAVLSLGALSFGAVRLVQTAHRSPRILPLPQTLIPPREFVLVTFDECLGILGGHQSRPMAECFEPPAQVVDADTVSRAASPSARQLLAQDDDTALAEGHMRGSQRSSDCVVEAHGAAGTPDASLWNGFKSHIRTTADDLARRKSQRVGVRHACFGQNRDRANVK